MLFLIAGDFHIRNNSPENRIDDYPLTQYEKIKWVLSLAQDNKATLLLPGDVFDNCKQTNYILQLYIKLFNQYNNVNILSVEGQHDMKYHSTDRQDTPLAVLEAAKALAVIDYQGYYLKECSIYGSSFNEEIPKTNKEPLTNFNILLTHRMIIHSDKIWGAQKEFDYAENLLRKHDFDLIVSGDNHHFFIAQQGNKTLVNCGSLMRTTTAQLEHIPKVVLFNTETRKYKEYEVPIKLVSEVFNLDKVIEKKEKKEKFEAFIQGLNESKGMDLNYQDNLDAYLKENNIDNEVVTILKEAING